MEKETVKVNYKDKIIDFVLSISDDEKEKNENFDTKESKDVNNEKNC